MRYLLVATWLLLSPLAPALAQVSIQFDLPGVRIGVSQPVYPELVQVPGYPVYYDPRADSNYFFYEGFYWVYQGDSWYSSSWYDGPWARMDRQEVPLFILRVPVRYYRRPPPYFQGWVGEAPPRWGERWGDDWERRHGGWDQWDRRAAPPPAPLPAYQRQYSGQRYPSAERQGDLRERNYRYEPRDAAVRPLTRAQPAPGRATERGQPPREIRPPSEPARHPSAPAAQQREQPQAQPKPRAEPQRPAAQERGGQGGKQDSKGEAGQSRGGERGGDRDR